MQGTFHDRNSFRPDGPALISMPPFKAIVPGLQSPDFDCGASDWRRLLLVDYPVPPGGLRVENPEVCAVIALVSEQPKLIVGYSRVGLLQPCEGNICKEFSQRPVMIVGILPVKLVPPPEHRRT